MNDKLNEYLKIDENLNVDYGGEYQTRIKSYLVNNADEALANKILTSNKNIPDCFQFVLKEVEKEYIAKCGKTSGGYACSDEHVYSLAIHYFDETSIIEEKVKVVKPKAEEKVEEVKPKVEENKKPKAKKLTKEEREANSYGGMTLFG